MFLRTPSDVLTWCCHITKEPEIHNLWTTLSQITWVLYAEMEQKWQAKVIAVCYDKQENDRWKLL
jgi:hypothetical protein